MTKLLDFNALTTLCERAIEAGLAPPPRDALFLGFDAAVKAATFSDAAPGDALKIEIDRLNGYIDPIEGDIYFLAMWLINAANKVNATRPETAGFFRNLADRVNAIPRPAPATGVTTAALIPGARAEALINPAVGAAVQILRGSMPGMNRRATNLMVSKRMHDALHHIQLYTLPMWSASVAALSSSPDYARQMVEDKHRELRDKSEALPGEFGFLSTNETLRAVAQQTTDALLSAAAAADTALAAGDADGLKSVIAKVRDIVKAAMPVYAGKMDSYQEGLDLSELVASLTIIAQNSSDDALNANASRLASSLTTIIQDLSVIGTQHSEWQLLDMRLGALENWFGFLHLGPSVYASFNLDWDAVHSAIETLSSQGPSERFDPVKRLREAFLQICPVPIQGAPEKEATKAFVDFVIQARTVFYGVDVRMKQICNQLREMTNLLAQL